MYFFIVKIQTQSPSFRALRWSHTSTLAAGRVQSTTPATSRPSRASTLRRLRRRWSHTSTLAAGRVQSTTPATSRPSRASTLRRLRRRWSRMRHRAAGREPNLTKGESHGFHRLDISQQSLRERRRTLRLRPFFAGTDGWIFCASDQKQHRRQSDRGLRRLQTVRPRIYGRFLGERDPRAIVHLQRCRNRRSTEAAYCQTKSSKYVCDRCGKRIRFRHRRKCFHQIQSAGESEHLTRDWRCRLVQPSYDGLSDHAIGRSDCVRAGVFPRKRRLVVDVSRWQRNNQYRQ